MLKIRKQHRSGKLNRTCTGRDPGYARKRQTATWDGLPHVRTFGTSTERISYAFMVSDE
jgi:hypothetical protein